MYARVVTSQVKPDKLNAMTMLYKNEIVPVIEAQPGFTNLLVLTDPKTNREISISTWAREADMVAFCDNHLPQWVEHFSELLVAPPTVEVYRVCCQAEAQDVPHKMRFGEALLGLNIEDPLDRNPAALESDLFGAQPHSPN